MTKIISVQVDLNLFQSKESSNFNSTNQLPLDLLRYEK